MPDDFIQVLDTPPGVHHEGKILIQTYKFIVIMQVNTLDDQKPINLMLS